VKQITQFQNAELVGLAAINESPLFELIKHNLCEPRRYRVGQQHLALLPIDRPKTPSKNAAVLNLC
jgi:hypothetical protein